MNIQCRTDWVEIFFQNKTNNSNNNFETCMLKTKNQIKFNDKKI